jgi:hypothetical protein
LNSVSWLILDSVKNILIPFETWACEGGRTAARRLSSIKGIAFPIRWRILAAKSKGL